MKKISTIILIFLGVFFFACNNNESNAQKGKDEVVSGQQLFMVNCAQCHRPAEDLTGPALKNVEDRWKDKSLMYAFINNPQEVIARDAYAKELFSKWKQAYMQPFPQLSKEEIDRILNYCNTAK